jgi:hypothetical protein
MSQVEVLSVRSGDQVDQAANTRVPAAEEVNKPDEMTVKSFSSSMVPESDKNAALIMTHIPVQQINDKKYTLPENKR